MNTFYLFEHHTGDDNDNSISDVVVEATSKEEAQSILTTQNKTEGYDDDLGNEEVTGMKYEEDTPYHSDFYFQSEHETLQDAESARAQYHGYYEILK